MIPISSLVHWTAALFLIAMASFALIEAKSVSLIPKSLFLWPLMGLLFSVLILAGAVGPMSRGPNKIILLVLGATLAACSVQALLVNVRKLSRWPSGAIWLSLLLITLMSQFPDLGVQEPRFQAFLHRLTGFVWGAIGVTKVIAERSAIQEGGTPVWILLLYVQAVLIASCPY